MTLSSQTLEQAENWPVGASGAGAVFDFNEVMSRYRLGAPSQSGQIAQAGGSLEGWVNQPISSSGILNFPEIYPPQQLPLSAQSAQHERDEHEGDEHTGAGDGTSGDGQAFHFCSTDPPNYLLRAYQNTSDAATLTVLLSWGRFGANPTQGPNNGVLGLVTLDVGPDFPASVLAHVTRPLERINRALAGDTRETEPITDRQGKPAAVRVGSTITLDQNDHPTMQFIRVNPPGASASDYLMLYRVPVSGPGNNQSQIVAVNPANGQSWNLTHSTRTDTRGRTVPTYSWVER